MDLTTFKPNTSDELLQGILGQVAGVVGADLNKFKDTCGAQLQSLATTAWNTQISLAKGEVTQADADIAMHTQELFLNNILLQADFMTYKLAQDALDAVFAVVVAAIKNLTGIPLKF